MKPQSPYTLRLKVKIGDDWTAATDRTDWTYLKNAVARAKAILNREPNTTPYPCAGVQVVDASGRIVKIIERHYKMDVRTPNQFDVLYPEVS